VNQDPNDPAAQFGVALLTAIAGLHNAGLDAGFRGQDIFGVIPWSLPKSGARDLADVFAMPLQMAARLQLFGPQALPSGSKALKATVPGLEDEGVTTEDLQIAVRNYFIPLLDSAIARLAAVANNAPAGEPLVVVGGGRNAVEVYPADFKLMMALLRVFKAAAHELVAYQLNAGDYDWNRDLVDFDANGDDTLTVAEYAPADPFLWRHTAPNMQTAGATLTAAFNNAIWALNNGAGSALVEDILGLDDNASVNETVNKLTDLRDLLTGQVDVQLTYDNAGSAQLAPATTRTVTMNLGAIYTNPINDIKDLFPTLHVVCSGNDCRAETQSADDFPDPTFHGVFPQPAPIRTIINGDYSHIVVRYGSVEITLAEP